VDSACKSQITEKAEEVVNDFISLGVQSIVIKAAEKSNRKTDIELCCCGCGTDASKSIHWCTSGKRVIAFHQSLPEEYEGSSMPFECHGCQPSAGH
jgi:hypothetical protein